MVESKMKPKFLAQGVGRPQIGRRCAKKDWS